VYIASLHSPTAGQKKGGAAGLKFEAEATAHLQRSGVPLTDDSPKYSPNACATELLAILTSDGFVDSTEVGVFADSAVGGKHILQGCTEATANRLRHGAAGHLVIQRLRGQHGGGVPPTVAGAIQAGCVPQTECSWAADEPRARA